MNLKLLDNIENHPRFGEVAKYFKDAWIPAVLTGLEVNTPPEWDESQLLAWRDGIGADHPEALR